MADNEVREGVRIKIGEDHFPFRTSDPIYSGVYPVIFTLPSSSGPKTVTLELDLTGLPAAPAGVTVQEESESEEEQPPATPDVKESPIPDIVKEDDEYFHEVEVTIGNQTRRSTDEKRTFTLRPNSTQDVIVTVRGTHTKGEKYTIIMSKTFVWFDSQGFGEFSPEHGYVNESGIFVSRFTTPSKIGKGKFSVATGRDRFFSFDVVLTETASDYLEPIVLINVDGKLIRSTDPDRTIVLGQDHIPFCKYLLQGSLL